MPPTITIIDGVMGAGKTTHMIHEMNRNPMLRYLYVTPFLDEVERIKQECAERNFQEPVAMSGTKTNGLKQLVERGANIVTTHALFTFFDMELQALLSSKGYTLVIDEALETTNIEYVSPIARQMIVQTKAVSINPSTALVTWNSFAFPSADGNDELARIKRQCDNEALYWLPRDSEKGDGFIAWHFPASAFRCFKKVFILTYQFEGSLMASYMKLNDLSYSIDSRFAALDQESRTKFKTLIEFIELRSKWVRELEEYDLSVSWYRRHLDDRAKEIRSSIKTLCSKHSVKANELMWTTFIGPALQLVNSKNILHKPLSKEATEAEKSKCNFVACNCRATNRYGNRNVLLYLCNRYPDLEIQQYFQQRGQTVDADRFALNEMLQWVFRSRIRNGKPIKLFLPSPRMRKLLEDWLDGKALAPTEEVGRAA